jgi:uncharacterized protein YecT (DUF1311 family)
LNFSAAIVDPCAVSEELPIRRPVLRTILTACLVLASLSGAATAENADAKREAETVRKDAAAARSLAAKHKAKGGDPETCIGQVAKQCAKAVGNRHNSTVRDCARRESEAWQSAVAEVRDRLGTHLDADQNAKLAAMQEAWLASRDRTCEFYYDFFDGTMAHPMIASCLNRENARRAIFLYNFLQNAEGN